jgi:hypothetical protein
MKTTKTCGDHLTDLIATRLFRFISIKKKFSSKDFEKKWRVRLARTFEFFKSPLDHIIITFFFSILKCVYWLIYLSEHVVIRINYFLRPSATKSKVAPPGGAKFKKLKNEQI